MKGVPVSFHTPVTNDPRTWSPIKVANAYNARIFTVGEACCLERDTTDMEATCNYHSIEKAFLKFRMANGIGYYCQRCCIEMMLGDDTMPYSNDTLCSVCGQWSMPIGKSRAWCYDCYFKVNFEASEL